MLGAYGDTRQALEVVSVVRARVDRALERLHALVAPEDPIIVGTVYDPATAPARRGGSGCRP